MEAFQYVKKPINNKITISLPDNFKDDEFRSSILFLQAF